MTIWLDMDGVLCDWFTATCKLHGYDPEQYPADTWDIAGVFGITTEQLFRPMGTAWWAWLKPTPEYHWLREILRHWRDMALLTTPYDDRSRQGKELWALLRWPGAPVVFADDGDKGKYACPGDVLLDDCDANIKAWRDAGGTGILMPRRWNSGWREPDTRRALEELLDYCDEARAAKEAKA